MTSARPQTHVPALMSRFSKTLHHFAEGHSGFPGIELIYTSHTRWPLPFRGREGSSDNEHDRLRSLTVSVLDSSFNPPTMAHLALARMCPPAPMSHGAETPPPRGEFDAKLLLFSTKNADKVPNEGDATYSQRVEMIVLLARELEQANERGPAENVAVALCREPTFVGKSTALRLFLQQRRLAAVLASAPAPAVQLVFLLGLDTLERLFAVRYYDSESAMKAALSAFLSPCGDNSRILCARRSTGASYSQTNLGVLDAAAEYIQSGAIVLADIGESERSLSSSEVRENIRRSVEEWERTVPSSIAQYLEENHLYKLESNPE